MLILFVDIASCKFANIFEVAFRNNNKFFIFRNLVQFLLKSFSGHNSRTLRLGYLFMNIKIWYRKRLDALLKNKRCLLKIDTRY